MRVSVVEEGAGYSYRVEPEPGDPLDGRRGFADAPASFRLARHGYRVQLPDGFRHIHPDRHATAIWLVLSPVIGTRLELPFAVSERFARELHEGAGVTLVRHAKTIEPAAADGPGRPTLLLSGGMDSMAASLVLPRDTAHLFLDRIPYPELAPSTDVLVDLARQRDAAATVAATGRSVLALREDHEQLFEPYPMWHSRVSILPGLYLADSVGSAVLDSGDVLDGMYLGGYHAGQPASWRFHAVDESEPSAEAVCLARVGLGHGQSICGLSEVGTSIVVNRSPYRGRTFSCYYPTDDFFCMRCDKCFKKLLLRHVADGEEIPAALVEHFLAIPYLTTIFDRPYFDWHHVWFYIFQQGRCSHWFFEELQRQARGGPDLTLLEKWYPGSRARMVPAYADAVVDAIRQYVPEMSAAEVAALESLDVPPLSAPRRSGQVAVPPPAAAPVPVASPTSMAHATPFVRWAADCLRETPAREWGDYALDQVTASQDGKSALAAFRRGAPDEQDQVTLMATLLEEGSPAPYLRHGRLGFCYRADTPLDTQARVDLMRRLVGRIVTAAQPPKPTPATKAQTQPAKTAPSQRKPPRRT